MRSRSQLSTSLVVVLGLVAGLLTGVVAVGIEEPGAAHAVPAPTFPSPECDIDEEGNEGLGCVPGDFAPVVSGTYAQDSTFTIDAGEIGLGACAWYTDTGCYYTVFSPSLVRCVYLENGDAFDVRPCSGALSTSGSVSAERQGSCTGSLGSVYADGGPGDAAWSIRGPRTAACQYEVNGTGAIDNLSGPTFYLVRASVEECVMAASGGCDERRFSTLEVQTGYAWLPVEGTLAPRASFETVRAGADGLAFRFDNTSIPFATGTTTYEWDFGDGTTSTAASPIHTFQSMGTKVVQLTMRSSEGPTRTATESIVLEPPDLRVLVYNPSAEFGPGKQGNRVNIGDEMTVKIKVVATEGVGHLDDVAPVDALLALPEQFEFVFPEPIGDDPPIDEPPTAEPRRFDPGDAAEFDVTIRAVGPGRATLRSIWNGEDRTGAVSGPWSGSFDVGVTGLQVEILPDPASFKRGDTDVDGDIDEDDNHVDVEVKVTNVTEAPITDVTKGELLVTSKTDDVLPRFLLVSSPVDDPLTTDVDEGDFGDLGPGESKSLTWTYGAEEAVHVDLSMLVTGNADDVTITALGEGVVKAFDNVVLEAEIKPGGNPSYDSGKAIRIDGVFTNVTDRPEAEEELTISFAAVPRFTEAPGSLSSQKLPLNGAAGYFGRSDGGRTPDGVEVFELGPGDSETLRSIVETLETELPTGFTVEYDVVASIKEIDENGDVTWTELGALEIDVVEEGEYSAEHRITLGPVPPEREDPNFFSCDPQVLWTAEYVGCKLVRGVETAARGLGDLMQLGWEIAHGTVAAYGYALGTYVEFVMQDADGRRAIAQEVVLEILLLLERGYRVVEGIDPRQVAVLVPRILDDAFTRLHNAWCGRTPQQQAANPQPCSGDARVFMGELAEIAGENVDMVFEALVAARSLAKLSKAVAATDGDIASAMARRWAQRDEQALARAQEVIDSAGPRSLPGARVLPAGVDVTDAKHIWRDSYGLSERQFTALQILTKKYGVNITLRSRAPGSIRLIENNLALPKPQGIKAKGVNDIDVDFLGYHPDYADKVVHMEPPIPLQQTYDGLRAASRDYALDAVRRKRPDLSPGSKEFDDLVAQVQERVITRHDEWGKLSVEYTDALAPNKNGQPTGVQVDFDGDFNGAAGERLRFEPNRRIELRPGRGGPDAGDRSVYEVKMQAPTGHPRAGEFLDVTGDVDFLAILKPDGTVLGANGDPAELAKRLQLYELMRANPIGMQHGESFTIAVGDEVRAKYLRDGVNSPGGETTLTMTPDQKLLTTYFDDGLSTLDLGDFTLSDAGKATAYFRGAFTELASPHRPWSRELVDQVVRSWRQFRLSSVLFDLSLLETFVAELAERVDGVFRRDGQVVRPDGRGGLERYQAADQSTRSSLVASSSLSTAAEVEVVASASTDPVLAELQAIVDGLVAQGFDPDPPGALGGRWVPVEVDDVLAGGRLSLAPFAYLATGAAAGEDTLVVTSREQLRVPESSPWFEVGDEIIVDPGGPLEERVTIASLSPFSLSSPLVNTHNDLTMVILAPQSQPVVGSLTPVLSARLADTRPGEETVDGLVEGTGVVPAGTSLRVPVHGRGGVPDTATAVVVNTVAVSPSGGGYLALYPCDEPVPSTSSVNYGSRSVDVNSAVVKLSADGAVCVFSWADTFVVMDVTAYTEGSEALAPKRLAESRLGFETDDGLQAEFGRVGARSTTEVQVAGRGGVPEDAAAVAVNVTVVGPSAGGYVTLFPCDEQRPLASNLNYGPGDVRPNSGIVALSAEGTLCVFSWAETDLIVDVTASFAEVPSFVALNPARLVETRNLPGERTVDSQMQAIGRLGAQSTTKVQIAGRGGVPAGATTAAVNAAVIGPSAGGFFTLFPCDEAMPLASSGNYEPFDVIANSGVVKLAGDGSICVFTWAETDFILDVNAAWTN